MWLLEQQEGAGGCGLLSGTQTPRLTVGSSQKFPSVAVLRERVAAAGVHLPHPPEPPTHSPTLGFAHRETPWKMLPIEYGLPHYS